MNVVYVMVLALHVMKAVVQINLVLLDVMMHVVLL